MGFEWYTDMAEPHSIIIRGVVPTSPAARSGLQNADRIIAIDGQPVSRVPDFAKLLARAPLELTLQIERRGRFQAIRLATTPSPSAQTTATENSRRDDTRDRRGRE